LLKDEKNPFRRVHHFSITHRNWNVKNYFIIFLKGMKNFKNPYDKRSLTILDFKKSAFIQASIYYNISFIPSQ